MKKFFILLLVLMLLTGCGTPAASLGDAGGGSAPTQQLTKVGISLPEASDPYWQACASALEAGLTALGLEPLIVYAENDVFLQAEQVVQLYTEASVDCLLIAPIDGVALAQTQQLALAGDVPVIALDRPLLDTAAVKYCVSFDYYAIGVTMGQHIETKLALKTAQQEQRRHTIEFFMGPAEDYNALLLHSGIMSVLMPYIDSGVLVCASGRVSFEDSCISRWDETLAKERLTRYIELYYSQEEAVPDICCAASDGLAAGCIEALEALGCPPEQWPLITGQGNGGEAADRVKAGKQSMTAVKNLSALTESAVLAVSALLEGTVPEGTVQVDNHVHSVPTRICPVSYLQAAE